MARNAVVFEIVKDKHGKHRWRLLRNKTVLDASSQGFKGGPAGAVRNFKRTRKAMLDVTNEQLANAKKACPK